MLRAPLLTVVAFTALKMGPATANHGCQNWCHKAQDDLCLSLLLTGSDGPVKAQDHALRAYARQRSLRQHVPIPMRPRSGANTPADRSGGLASISSGDSGHLAAATKILSWRWRNTSCATQLDAAWVEQQPDECLRAVARHRCRQQRCRSPTARDCIEADQRSASAGVLDDLARGALPISGRNHISRSASVTGVLSGSSSGSLRMRDPISGSFGGRTR